MSAEKVAAEKVLRLCEQSWGHFHPDAEPVLPVEAAALIAAEYAPLIQAVRDEISSCPGCDGCGIVGNDYTDDEEICGECEALRSALAHIEGDATP